MVITTIMGMIIMVLIIIPRGGWKGGFRIRGGWKGGFGRDHWRRPSWALVVIPLKR
jgi:hypothetical protein